MEQGFTETEDFARFKACILRKAGIDLNLYKPQQMHRRLLGMVERAKTGSFMEYYQILERDTREYALFLDRLTINVSELFRNPEKWQELRTRILPPMLERKRPLKVWSAGCSYGAEPYSLAILLDQMSPGIRHAIHATDLDRTILAKAREGRFTAADIRNVEADVQKRYFTQLSAKPGAEQAMVDLELRFQVNAEIRRRVEFSAQNLLSDPFGSDYDLICCRNVVIYFTDEAKDRLFQRFRSALRPGGVLFVGGTERIFNSAELGFDSPLPFFYRRTIN